jgi:hypothetical protein
VAIDDGVPTDKPKRFTGYQSAEQVPGVIIEMLPRILL